MTTPQPAALPGHTIGKHDHPEPHTMCWSELELGAIKRYAESYALSALQSQPAAAGVSDAEIRRAWYDCGVGKDFDVPPSEDDMRFARAILALRPQAVPMTEFQRGTLVIEHLGPEALAGGQMSVLDAFVLGIDAAEDYYGITAQAGGEGNGSIDLNQRNLTFADVHQIVPVAASDAHKVKARIVNLGLNGLKQDPKPAGYASPHDPPPPAANPVPSDVQRDADRYRFLKSYDKNCEDLAICKWSDTGWSGEWVVEHDPDAVIDAALTKKAQQ